MNAPVSPAGSGVPGPLPVPVPFSANFALIFADNSFDHTNRYIGALMGPFLHDLANQANNTDTSVIKDGLVQSGAQRQLLIPLRHRYCWGEVTAVSVPPPMVDDLLTANPDLNNKLFAFEGEQSRMSHTLWSSTAPSSTY